MLDPSADDKFQTRTDTLDIGLSTEELEEKLSWVQTSAEKQHKQHQWSVCAAIMGTILFPQQLNH